MEKADVRFNNDKNLSYSVSYVPKASGLYKIFVTFLGKDIPNSPFDVHISEKAGDVTKVSSYGPGLQSDSVFCGHTTYFDISTKGIKFLGRNCRNFFNDNFIRCGQWDT